MTACGPELVTLGQTPLAADGSAGGGFELKDIPK